MNKTALVFGASGLVGGCLIKQLEKNPAYSNIITVVRRNLGGSSNKIEEIISDYSELSNSLIGIKADVVFICLGTTIKKAGSVEKVEQIDRDLPIEIAGIMKRQGATKLAVVSSVGANEKSSNYYLRIKGEMEEGLKGLAYENLAIVRPSMILGERNEKRFAESIGKVIMKAVGFVLIGRLRKYRAIHAQTIAKSMITIIENNYQEITYESDRLAVLGA